MSLPEGQEPVQDCNPIDLAIHENDHPDLVEHRSKRRQVDAAASF
jgi:hypothetical protein